VRVLVADDSRSVRELLVMLLDMEVGFTVVGQARDGLDAVALAQQLQPDLVILDVSMPRLDGIEALPRVRAACPRSRVVIFTGDSDGSMEGEARDAGAAAVIAKEIGAATLIDHLRALCEPTLRAEQLPAAG
jgi:DNA-binding NarL/FixJ family response regulator